MKLPKHYLTDTIKGGDFNTLRSLHNWIMDKKDFEQDGLTDPVLTIEMTESQFWQLANLSTHDAHHNPWRTFMGRKIVVTDMPERVQLELGLLSRYAD